MAMLIAAALLFLALHFLISGTRLRDVITETIGDRAYLGLFSLASLAAIVWLAIGYNRAQAGADPQLFDLGQGVRHLGIPVIAIAFFLGVQGLLVRNPTRVQMGQPTAAPADVIHGVVRVTRHPFLWSVVIWSAFHLAANGDEASVIFFGTFFLVSLFGTAFIDAKRRRKMGAAWEAFAAKTSNIPFAAVISGRNTLNFTESLGWRFWAAVVVFVAVLFTHYHLFGVSPFPGGWVPF
ncbi:MAG TPA: NnrU family protein [Rhizomicrobium sp.]|nr:NnrU family protein [Rhizomicrobium sp.]